MGETWLGVQHGAGGFEQRVCLKFIHDAFRDTDGAGELFMREAAIAASLRHSNIVGVIDADASCGYMALELVDGIDLRSLLREVPGQRLPPPVVSWIAIELCKALQHAHTHTRGNAFAGVVHRDISPGNVLISRSGEVKLADFGVAKAIRATGDVVSAVRGKLSYMCPEQMSGRNADARSDLFSLGVLLYEMLTGERPFDGQSDADTVRRVMHGLYEPLAPLATGAPPELIAVVERLLQTDPDQRLQSAADVIDALAERTPPATIIFELAGLVQRTRPHQTLLTEPLPALPHNTPGFASAEAPLPSVAHGLPRAPRRVVLGLGLLGAGLLVLGALRLLGDRVQPTPAGSTR